MLSQLVTAAAVGALSPVAAMATIVLLRSGRPVASVLACLLGWSTVLFVLAVGLSLLLADQDGTTGRSAKVAVQLIIGLVLVAAALRTLVGGEHPLQPTADPDRPPAPQAPGWMQTLTDAGPGKALLIGAVLIAVSPADIAAYLSGVQAVVGAHLGTATTIALSAALIVCIDLCILIPLGVYLAMGRRADALLAAGQTWLIANQRAVTGWSAGVFGVVLLGQAVTTLV